MMSILENHIAHDPDTLAYPNISTCLSVTVNARGGDLIGTHLTTGHTQPEIDGTLDKMFELCQGKVVKEVVLAGAIPVWAQAKPGLSDRYRLPGFKDTLFDKFKTRRIATINTITNTSTDNHTLIKKDANDKIVVQVWTRSGNEASSVLAENTPEMAGRIWKMSHDGSFRKERFIPVLSLDGIGKGRVQDKTHDLRF